MGRMLPLLLLLALMTAIALSLYRLARPRQRGTYRPRAKPHPDPAPRAGPGTAHVIPQHQLDGVRDAYSSAAIDAAQPLYCCAECQALYHATSLDALQEENRGRCAICGGSDFGPVRVSG